MQLTPRFLCALATLAEWLRKYFTRSTRRRRGTAVVALFAALTLRKSRCIDIDAMYSRFLGATGRNDANRRIFFLVVSFSFSF